MRWQFLEESGRCFEGFAARSLETRGAGGALETGQWVGDRSVLVKGSVVRRGYGKEIGVEAYM